MKNVSSSALGLLMFAGVLLAQLDQGEISGFVKDPSSAAVVGAAVKIRNEASGFVFQSKTNERGFYQAPNLVPGLYNVEVESPGFKKFSESHVKLDAASTATVNADLIVGALTESVEIVANATPLQTDSAQVGRVVETKQIEDLTLRDWPLRRLVELWNGLPGMRPVQRFEDRTVAVARLWRALQPAAPQDQAEPSSTARKSAGRRPPPALLRDNSKAARILGLLARPEGAL